MTTTDSKAFWNDMWGETDEAYPDHDAMLVTETKGLKPGRALDIGCGAGGNAVWLAEQGWQVTAVDLSDVAVEKGRRLAIERGVNVDFIVSNATTFQPDSLFDLITSFYIQVPPEGRARMLSNAANSLAPGGTLLFVSHDRSAPPEGWSDEHIASLTTPDEVASEIPVLKIEQAYVSEHADAAHMGNSDERHESHSHEADDHDADAHSKHESHDSCGSGSTVVRARRL